MKLLLIAAGLCLFGFANAYFQKKISCSFGYNIGENYMKKQWGIDTENNS